MRAACTVALCALVLSACTASRTPVRDHAPLATLYQQDQADRRGTATWDAAMDQRDAARRQSVKQMLARGEVRTGADHYHAAMILQHGSDSTAFRQAHTLATRAVALGDARARWLSAATLDRWLLSTGRPQHYGTQFTEEGGVWYVSPLDTLAVTDAARRRLGVPPLDSLRAFLARKNGTPTGSLAPPPAPEPHRPSVYVVGGVEAIARAVVYPDAARRAGLQGRVLVQLEVEPDGQLAQAVVIEGLSPEVDAAVLEAVRAARFVNHAGERWEIRLRVPVAPR